MLIRARGTLSAPGGTAAGEGEEGRLGARAAAAGRCRARTAATRPRASRGRSRARPRARGRAPRTTTARAAGPCPAAAGQPVARARRRRRRPRPAPGCSRAARPPRPCRGSSCGTPGAGWSSRISSGASRARSATRPAGRNACGRSRRPAAPAACAAGSNPGCSVSTDFDSTERYIQSDSVTVTRIIRPPRVLRRISQASISPKPRVDLDPAGRDVGDDARPRQPLERLAQPPVAVARGLAVGGDQQVVRLQVQHRGWSAGPRSAPPSAG